MSLMGPTGLRADYEVVGDDGPVVLLTHSFLCDRSMWRHQRQPLIDRGFRLIEVDLPGHGIAPPVTRPFAIEDLTDVAVSILDAEDVEQAIWCGLSIGGMLSQRAALMHPERVTALVLADTSAAPEPAPNRVKYEALGWFNQLFGMDRIVGQVEQLYFGETTRREQPDLLEEFAAKVAEKMDAASIRRYVRALTTRSDLTETVDAIGAPTLVIVGAEDAALPPERSRALADAISGARYETVADAGHLSPLEHPEAFNGPLLEFLEPYAPQV